MCHRSQGLLVDVEHASAGEVALPGPPLRFFDPAGPDGEVETTKVDHAAPPLLNADEEEIRAWLAG